MQSYDINLICSKYLHVNAIATTVVKTGSGSLKALNVNFTAGGRIQIYDGIDATGTIIANLADSVHEGSYIYNCVVSTGICVVTAGTPDITVIYD